MNELYHYGIPGMKWGKRKAHNVAGANLRSKNLSTKKTKQEKIDTKSSISKKLSINKNTINKLIGPEMIKRGKSAIDVLKNGDTDWMGNHSYNDDSVKEMKNRGKAAIERLMYSQEQIDNKKFFGRYDF